MLSSNKFPKCPLCFVRHNSRVKKCFDIIDYMLIVKPDNTTHPRAKEMIEYIKEFKSMEKTNVEISTGTSQHKFEQ